MYNKNDFILSKEVCESFCSHSSNIIEITTFIKKKKKNQSIMFDDNKLYELIAKWSSNE